MKNQYNVILIGIDTLRADHLGCYGYERPTSPNIDALAEQGIFFANCFSQAPITAPSFMSIFTSRYPSYHGIIDNIARSAAGRAYVADPKIPTLAEILKQNGYHTAAFTGGGHLYGKLGFEKGFDYYDYPKYEAIPTDEIFNYLKNFSGSRFFLFLHTYAVHNPWRAPKKYWNMFETNYNGPFRLEKITEIKRNLPKENSFYLEFLDVIQKQVKRGDSALLEYYKAIYDGAIKYVDDFIGKLFLKLGELKLKDRTIIIFTADHGEEFMDHGRMQHAQLYNELLRVPLIIKIADGSTPRTITQIVRSIDIMPTILDTLGINIESPIHGASLLPAIKKDFDLGLSAVADTEVYGHCIQDKNYKYIYPRYRKKTERIDELYDLKTDPLEKNNIALENLDIVEKMANACQSEIHRLKILPPYKKIIYLGGGPINIRN